MAPQIIPLDQLPPVSCPCGVARRALMDSDQVPFSLHLTQINRTAQAHYHQKTTEVYVVVDCEPDAEMEIDRHRYPLRPRMAIVLPPGCVHRLVGKAEVLIIALPKFDVQDEFLADSSQFLPTPDPAANLPDRNGNTENGRGR